MAQLAHVDPNLAAVWPPNDLAFFSTDSLSSRPRPMPRQTVQCPGSQFCRHNREHLPDYWFSVTSRGRRVCEDRRLFLAWQQRRRWMRELGDDEDQSIDRCTLGFAAALAEMKFRDEHAAEERAMLMKLAGKPEKRIDEDEVRLLLDQVMYALDCFFEVCPDARAI